MELGEAGAEHPKTAIVVRVTPTIAVLGAVVVEAMLVVVGAVVVEAMRVVVGGIEVLKPEAARTDPRVVVT